MWVAGRTVEQEKAQFGIRAKGNIFWSDTDIYREALWDFASAKLYMGVLAVSFCASLLGLASGHLDNRLTAVGRLEGSWSLLVPGWWAPHKPRSITDCRSSPQTTIVQSDLLPAGCPTLCTTTWHSYRGRDGHVDLEVCSCGQRKPLTIWGPKWG